MAFSKWGDLAVRSRWAARRVSEVREPDAGFGQAVDIGRADLAAVAAEVGPAEVVGQNDENVGSRPCREGRSRNAGGRRGAQELSTVYSWTRSLNPIANCITQGSAVCWLDVISPESRPPNPVIPPDWRGSTPRC